MLKEVIDCQIEIANTIKILIYNQESTILEKVNFDDDEIFLEPLLFTYFNYKDMGHFTSNDLNELMQGYFIENNNDYFIKKFFNKQNIAYIPNVGYFNKSNQKLIEKIQLVDGTKIEVLRFSLYLLDFIFKNENESYIDEIIIDKSLYESNISFLTNAFNFIKQNSYDHYKLIEQCCKKIILFKTSPDNTNSFATINAHGIAFLNVYQEDYNVVFFIDDIAHQTGHIILTTLLYNRKKTFKIDENQNIGEILKKNDHRSFYILFHALYTYYTTFLCIDSCLENNSFNSNEQKEAIARIGFYLNKCTSDLNNFKKFIDYYNGIENVLTSNGIEIYNLIEAEYRVIDNKWNDITSKLNYNNQTYNFTFEIFIKNNS